MGTCPGCSEPVSPMGFCQNPGCPTKCHKCLRPLDGLVCRNEKCTAGGLLAPGAASPVQPFRCCERPMEVDLTLSARLGSNTFDATPVKFWGCQRCGVVYFREGLPETAPVEERWDRPRSVELLPGGWYLVEGVRYCARCRSRRCVRQEGGMVPCPSPDHSGFYRIHWKEGGSSLAAVGGLHSGQRWFAPINWASDEATGIASKDWSKIERVTPVVEALPKTRRQDEGEDEGLVVSDDTGRYRVHPVVTGPAARWEGSGRTEDEQEQDDDEDDEEIELLDPIVTAPGESLIEKVAEARKEKTGCDDCGMEIDVGGPCGNPECPSNAQCPACAAGFCSRHEGIDPLYAGLAVCDGKYSFRLERDDWRVFVRRYNEDWLVLEKGARAISALMSDLAESRQEAASLRMQLVSSQREVATLRAASVDWKHTEGRGGKED